MSVVLESQMLRDFLHHLVDGLVDELEGRAASPARPPSPRPGPRADTSRRRITLAEKAEKPAPHPPWKIDEVTVSCRRDCGRLAIAVALSAEVAGRLGLKPYGKAAADLQAGKLRVRASKEGAAVYSVGGASGRVFFHIGAHAVGVIEGHRAEACTFHYDLEDELLIDPPGWLKPKPTTPQKPKTDPPATCTKLYGTNPIVKCATCEKAPATVLCNLCPTLLCNACWDPHVRTHWHSSHKGKAATAARDARQAMRSSA